MSSRLLYEDQAKPAEKIEVSAREKRDEELQNIKVGDAREKFFSSMISSSETKSSSAHRLGTSLLPTGIFKLSNPTLTNSSFSSFSSFFGII